MAITTALSNNFLSEIASGAQLITDTYKAVLIKVGHAGTYDNTFVTAGTPGTGSPSATNIGTDEVTGTGYTSGGIALGAPLITASVGKTLVDFADSVAITNCTFSTVGCVIINTTRGNKVVGCVNFGGTQTVTAQDFSIDFPATGATTSLFRVTTSPSSIVALPTVSPNLLGAPAWDAGYRAGLARAKAGTGLCRIAALTDSVGYGYYASNLDTTSWLGILKTTLQAQYGDGGSGIVSTARTKIVLTADARATAIQNAWETAGNLVATTGTWTEITNGTDGPGGSVIQASTVGATATFVVRGTTVEIFYQSTPSTTSAGSFTYQIDGGAVSSPIQSYRVTQGAVEKITVTGLSAGNHTVVITATDANGTLTFSLCGVSGRNASGVVLDQCSRGGQTSDVLNTNNSASWTSAGGKAWGGSAQNLRGSVVSWNGGTNRPCDLAILAFGLNDSTTDKTPTTLFNNHRMALEAIRAGNPDASILIVRNHRGAATIDGTAFYYSQYERELQALAKAWNCGILNLWAAGKNSYSYMNGLGYWSTANTQVGIAGTDVVHLSDAGHAWVASLALQVLG